MRKPSNKTNHIPHPTASIYFEKAAAAIAAIATALTLLTACSDEALAPETEAATTPAITDCEPGQLIVKFAPGLEDVLSSVTTRTGLPSTDEALEILGAYRLERVFPEDKRWKSRSDEAGMNLWYVVHYDPETMTPEQAVKRISPLADIQCAQVNRHIHPSYNRNTRPVAYSPSSSAAAQSNAPFFNDPGLPQQWHYINDGTAPFAQEWAPVLAGSDIGLRDAWPLCTGDTSIIVAVMDEGVMYNHPDLAANMWVNEGETMAANTDADGNGYCGDLHGYNFVRDNGFLSAFSVNDTGHGTHVAGTIAAVNGNGTGVCGIAGGDPSHPGVRIMSLQIFDDNKTATLVGEARAMKYAADNGAVIIQCSWGYNSYLSNELDGFTPGPATTDEWNELYPLEKEALDYFIHNAGSPNGVIDGGLAIFASGNEYAACSSFPAAYEKCVSVAAIAADYTPACYTDYGSEVRLCAPGGDAEYYGEVGTDEDYTDWSSHQGSILSTLCIDGAPTYGYYEGTSMACPHVAGVAALGLSYAAKTRRHFTREEFIDLMVSTAKDVDAYYAERGEKIYHKYHNSWGAPTITMNLNNYIGKMGRLVDAGALLNAIESAGSDMRLPNIYVAAGDTQSLNLAAFYIDGETLTYTATIDNPAVATATVSNTTLLIHGLTPGQTRLTVSTPNAQPQTVTITVRQTATHNGWL